LAHLTSSTAVNNSSLIHAFPLSSEGKHISKYTVSDVLQCRSSVDADVGVGGCGDAGAY